MTWKENCYGLSVDSELEEAIWEVERPRRVLARDGEGEGRAWAVRENRSWAVPVGSTTSEEHYQPC